MHNTPMNQKQYATAWKNESIFLESNGVYKKLLELIPSGDVLEIGCGIGLGTGYLSNGRSVLVLDNNPHLITEAKTYLDSKKSIYHMHECDLFSLTDNDKEIIRQFKPKIIVGWFIGSDGMNVSNRTKEESNINNKGKLYREKIEDIITSNDICIESVDTISFAIRVGRVKGVSHKELYDSQKNDYDTYVFRKINFEVCNVTYIDWLVKGSNFRYSHAANPNLTPGNIVPSIVCITAKRKIVN